MKAYYFQHYTDLSRHGTFEASVNRLISSAPQRFEVTMITREAVHLKSTYNGRHYSMHRNGYLRRVKFPTGRFATRPYTCYQINPVDENGNRVPMTYRQMADKLIKLY